MNGSTVANQLGVLYRVLRVELEDLLASASVDSRWFTQAKEPTAITLC